MSNAWLVRWEPRPDAQLRLICFPYAGVGASVYRLWQRLLPASVEMVAIQLPGRETRLRETPLREISHTVDSVLPHLVSLSEKPSVFFGHSMGAVVAWDAVRALREAGHSLPAHVILSGRRAPGTPDRDAPLRHLSDEQFVVEINRRYGGIPPQVAADRDMMALLLPALRADIEALETHAPPVVAPLDVPLTVFGGTTDERARPDDLEVWRGHTNREFRVKTFPGGHFYLNSVREAVVANVAEVVTAVLASAGHATEARHETGR